MNYTDVIIRPLLSEKTYKDIANKRYTFIVHPDATKIDVKIAVEQVFGVKVSKVNIARVGGKFRRHGATSGYTSDYKKAIVTLTSDSKAIEFFESLA